MQLGTNRTARFALTPAIIVLGVLAGVLAAFSSATDAQDCGIVADCLGDAITALILAGAIPIVLAVGMVITGFPLRDYLTIPIFGVLALGSVTALDWLNRWARGFGHADPATPWWAWLATMPILLLASWLAVRRAPTPSWLRVLAPVLIAALLVSATLSARQAKRNHNASRIAQIAVTYYLPELPNAELRQVWATDSRVQLSYLTSEPVRFTYVDLIEAAGLGTCAAVEPFSILGLDAAACADDEFDSVAGDYRAVVVRRADTVLVASTRTAEASADELYLALRQASAVSARELAGAARQP